MPTVTKARWLNYPVNLPRRRSNTALPTSALRCPTAKPPKSACSWTPGADATAARLKSGFALTIDYGRTATDLYDPAQRPHGTLVTYRNHRQTDAPLQDVGRQDITAQVDFTSVQRAGQRAGLADLGNVPQGWLLHRLGLQTLRRNAAPRNADSRDWLTNLTHLARPGGLGDFRVLLQAKNVAAEPAAAALSWLNDDDAAGAYGYHPSSLAALIPPEALCLGAERIRIGG